MEAAILHRESDAGELLNIFSRSITEWEKEGKTASGEDVDNDEYREVGVEAKYKKTTITGKVKQTTTETLTAITDNYDNILALL